MTSRHLITRTQKHLNLNFNKIATTQYIKSCQRYKVKKLDANSFKTIRQYATPCVQTLDLFALLFSSLGYYMDIRFRAFFLSVLPKCSFCDTEATLFFLAGPVCSCFSAEACAILQTLCWSRRTNKSATSLFFSSFPTLALSSLPCPSFHLFYLSFYLNLSGRSGRNCFLFCSIRLQWVPGQTFFPGKDAADGLARRGTLLMPSAVPFSLSPLISRIHYLLGLEM